MEISVYFNVCDAECVNCAERYMEPAAYCLQIQRSNHSATLHKS